MFKKSWLFVQSIYLWWLWLILQHLSSHFMAHWQFLIASQMMSFWSVVLKKKICFRVCVFVISRQYTYSFSVCVCSCLFGWRCDLWLFNREGAKLEGRREGGGMERQIEALMNRLLWKKSVSAKEKRNEVIIFVLTCGLQNTHIHTHTRAQIHTTQSAFHQQQQHLGPSLLLHKLPCFVKRLCPCFSVAWIIISSSLRVIVSSAYFRAFRLPPPWFIFCNPTITLITIFFFPLHTSLLQSLAPGHLPALLLLHFLSTPAHPSLEHSAL